MAKNSADEERDTEKKNRFKKKFFCDVPGNYPIHHGVCQKYLRWNFR